MIKLLNCIFPTSLKSVILTQIDSIDSIEKVPPTAPLSVKEKKGPCLTFVYQQTSLCGMQSMLSMTIGHMIHIEQTH